MLPNARSPLVALAAVLLCVAEADVFRVTPHGAPSITGAPPPTPAVRIAHPRDNGFVTVGQIVFVDIAHAGWSFERDGDVCIDVGDGIGEVRSARA